MGSIKLDLGVLRNDMWRRIHAKITVTVSTVGVTQANNALGPKSMGNEETAVRCYLAA